MVDDYESLRKKYLSIIKEKLNNNDETVSSDYINFRSKYLPKKLNWYESACKKSEKILKIDYDPKKIVQLKKAIETCHLMVSPSGVASFALLFPLILIFVAILIFYAIPILLGFNGSLFLLIFFIFFSLILIFPLNNIPFFLARSWIQKANNQLVLSVFYLVTFLRHTSNLELAINFASSHLEIPLALDFKKILWDVETEKYSTIKESIDNYLNKWVNENPSFVESMHLIESSLLESSESRRLSLLEKSLDVILEGTYEKMLHYAHNLKSPLTNLHMLGIVLPILTLVILPLVVGFIPEIKWYHLLIFYDFFVPLSVFFLGMNILSKRPSSVGSSLSHISKKKDFLIKNLSLIILLFFFFIGFMPLIYHWLNPDFDIVIKDGYLQTISINDPEYQDASFYFIGLRPLKNLDKESFYGPFGLGATLFSLFLPLGLGFSIGFYFKKKSEADKKYRDRIKKIEQEFADAIFQLGNRLSDGLSLEIAFGKVAEVITNSTTGLFFKRISENIANLGLSVEKAIFDEKLGAINFVNTPIVSSTMKVLVESSKKGPLIASEAMMAVSSYIKEIHRVDERLRDLMSDVISSMKSQASFLTPIISAIIIGITSMITKIIGSLTNTFSLLSSEAQGVNNYSALLELFGQGGIPTFYFQIVVGLYVIILSFILAKLINGIENGSDKLEEEFLIGNTLLKSTLLYVSISFVIVILFNLMAVRILGSF